MTFRFAALALAGLTLATPAVAQDTSGEAKLAKMLEGRVAGEPQSCIRSFPVRDFTVIDGTALVYESGTTLYVNYTRDPESLDSDDVLVVKQSGPNFCDTDIVTTQDRSGGFYTGNIFLTEFIPYEKVDEAD